MSADFWERLLVALLYEAYVDAFDWALWAEHWGFGESARRLLGYSLS